VRLAPPDREEVKAAARRFIEAGLYCGVETERDGRWESRLLALRAAKPREVLAAVEETLALRPGERVRLAGYSPSSLARTGPPAPVVCSPPALGGRLLVPAN
jgi:ribulose bisphosphate carboxylase small subunit